MFFANTLFMKNKSKFDKKGMKQNYLPTVTHVLNLNTTEQPKKVAFF